MTSWNDVMHDVLGTSYENVKSYVRAACYGMSKLHLLNWKNKPLLASRWTSYDDVEHDVFEYVML